MRKTKLFCFPYAGGSAALYSKWNDLLHSSIALQPVELAGRGKRIYEPHYQDIGEAIDDVFHIVKDQVKVFRYALFGHSLGALIAFELAMKLRALNLPAPEHIFFSGRGAPHIPRSKDRKIYHKLPDDEFKESIMELGGTPKEFFEYPELLEILLPTLKNDFRISETYTYAHYEDAAPFSHDITVFLGKDESVTPEQMAGWRQHSQKVCSIYYYEGGHFFIHDKMAETADIINRTLAPGLGTVRVKM